MNKLKIWWKTQPHELAGNALGYNTHNSFMRQYSQPFFDFDDTSDICLQITPADHYVPQVGKFNVLFTMWETTEIPTAYVRALNMADLVIVPSRFCKDLFRKYTNKPIEVCWEGVEGHNFPYVQRSFPQYGQPFRFLWSGAPNPRKGSLSVTQVAKMVEQIPAMELYIKTTAQKFDRKEFISSMWERRRDIRSKVRQGLLSPDYGIKPMLQRSKLRESGVLDEKVMRYGANSNIIMDTRKLPLNELVDLYNSAHCFLLPTLGEGWGLTLCEAMATGCPSIATAVTGCADFFDDEVGYSLKYTIHEWFLENYNVRAGVHVPDTIDLADKMLHVFKQYGEALKKGKRASDRIHSKFTWDKSGRRLFEIIQKYMGVIQCVNS